VPGWTLENGHLKRTFEFDDSEASIASLTTWIVMSTEEGHIPDLALREGKFVEVGPIPTRPAAHVKRFYRGGKDQREAGQSNNTGSF